MFYNADSELVVAHGLVSVLVMKDICFCHHQVEIIGENFLPTLHGLIFKGVVARHLVCDVYSSHLLVVVENTVRLLNDFLCALILFCQSPSSLPCERLIACRYHVCPSI